MARWKLVYFLQGIGALRCLLVVSGVTATYFGVCLLWEHFYRRTGSDDKVRAIPVVDAWRPLVAIQLALMGTAAYLYTYTTLGDAVSSDNLALAEKRLNWNLEGLGPNNGLIVKLGSQGVELFPLFPEAVKNGNYDLVKLLVKHGADLNPKDWDYGYWSMDRGTYVRNLLYFPVIGHDLRMIDFLIDLGVNPEQGIYPALMKNDRKLLGYFLEKGVSLEFALDVAKKKKGYSQQQIDQFFADFITKSTVDIGQ